MKISDLIKELKKVTKQHGDLEVWIYQNSSPMLPSESLFTKRDLVVAPEKNRRYSNDPEYLPKRLTVVP